MRPSTLMTVLESFVSVVILSINVVTTPDYTLSKDHATNGQR